MPARHAEIAWARPDDLTAEQLELLGASLPGFPIVKDTGYLLYLQVELPEEVELTLDAINIAADIAARASRRAWGALVDPVQIAVYPTDAGLVPSALDLVGQTDIAAELGVSRQAVAQRVDQLPGRVATISGGPVWVRSAVRAVTSTWSSRPGRRPATQEDGD